MEFYQWVVAFIAIFYSVRIGRQFYLRKRLLKGTVIWFIFWLFIVVLAIIPDLFSQRLAQFFGFKDNINAIIFVALGFLFLFNMYFNMTVEKLERQFTEVIRKQAIKMQLLEDELAEQKKEENRQVEKS